MEIWPKLNLNTDREYAMCYGCGESNPFGLKLKFQWDGKTARAEFTPHENHQGWSGYLHGGITACVLDEAMAWAAMFTGLNNVTAKMQVRYKQVAPIGKTYVVTCTITKNTHRLIETEAVLTDQNGEIFAEGASTQFVVKSQEGSQHQKHDW
jgi:acyl-coenzyme A thioesterase PaaI-like protein